MATFITTIDFTQQGIAAVDQTTKRAAAIKASAKKFGVKVNDIYWTFGNHDGLLIFDAPDDESATAMLLYIASMGFVTTTTCRAYNSAEMDQILKKMSQGSGSRKKN